MPREISTIRPLAALRRGLTVFAGALAAASAAVVAGLLAVFFAATVVVVAFMASILLTLAAAAARTRRRVRSPATDPEVIEARHVGGHSWVAYGWDGRP
jgi:hypothetical protein